jgi:hypothetical protein
LLSSVEVFTAFWGAAWLAAESPLMQQMNDFFLYILASPLMDQLREYSVPGTSVGHGTLAGTTIIPDRPPGSTVTDAEIQTLIQTEIAKNTLPKTNANSLYFLFLPPGVEVDLGGQKSCSNFCGYHDSIGAIYYAVVPYPGCSGCVGGLHALDALTSTTSHELCEAITDPVPGQGWYDNNQGEIGDICAWRTKRLSTWTVQLEWSNQRGACI